jgi:TonB family protein
LSEEKKYKNYTAADIEKYYRGLLSPKEMNELEQAALDDPFLADALEGYEATTENISSDLSELKKKLEEKVSDKKVLSIAPSSRSFKWWKVAAAVVILGGLGYLIFEVSTSSKTKEVAVKMEEKKPTAPARSTIVDSNKSITPESTRVAGTNKQIKATTKPNPETKKTTQSDLNAEANKNDLAVEITRPSQPASNYKEQKDSINVNPSSAVKAPAAIEKRSAPATEDKLYEAPQSFKKEESDNRQQENYFKGRIKDANNKPVPFANITNMQDNVSTYADAQGRFTLVAPDSVLNVRVRSVGFENSTAQLKNNVANNEVVLQESKTAAAEGLSVHTPDTDRSPTANVFEEVEPVDGWSNYNTYLANNINVPEDLKRKKDVMRQVQLSFEVNKHGNPVNIKIEKSLCGKCDEEAIRVVKQGPKWKKKNQKTKRITISVPFDTEK